MKQPDGSDDGRGRVYKLVRTSDGLKQAPHCWNERYDTFMRHNGFKISDADPCLYMRVRNGKKLIAPIYVDDGMIAGSDLKVVEAFIRKLKAEFKITSGPLSTYVGTQIQESSDGIFINQNTYSTRILERFKIK